MNTPDLQQEVDWAYQRIRHLSEFQPITSRFRGKIRYWNCRVANQKRRIVHYVNPILYEEVEGERDRKQTKNEMKQEEERTQVSQRWKKDYGKMEKVQKEGQPDMILKALRPQKKKKIFKQKIEPKKLVFD